VEDGWVQMVQVQVDVVFLGTHSAASEDLHCHRAADDVSGGEVLS
jgi:hypothetical protein